MSTTGATTAGAAASTATASGGAPTATTTTATTTSSFVPFDSPCSPPSPLRHSASVPSLHVPSDPHLSLRKRLEAFESRFRRPLPSFPPPLLPRRITPPRPRSSSLTVSHIPPPPPSEVPHRPTPASVRRRQLPVLTAETRSYVRRALSNFGNARDSHPNIYEIAFDSTSSDVDDEILSDDAFQLQQAEEAFQSNEKETHRWVA